MPRTGIAATLLHQGFGGQASPVAGALKTERLFVTYKLSSKASRGCRTHELLIRNF